ncbi:hypothetical protein MNBD_GAMMA01-1386 [hydrothermal vent metagenome]|uniref:Abi-like protein n=1 Tax=hydrothermal vent metagenome TaxID=652676 RepID=A0A3B0VUA4_9ZZZZ
MTFSHTQLSNIPKTLSDPRFTTYLQHCDNSKELALQLYQWNLELSSAFIVPLHFLEISIRNAVVEGIESVHAPNWAWNQGYIRSLPNPSKGYSPQRDLQEVAKKQPTIGKVVAELKFVFWEKMFTSRHDGLLWNHHIKNVFPHAPSSMSVSQLRAAIHNDIFTIRKLRNRIAHHEPIFLRDSQGEYNKIHELVSWRDEATSDWMNDIQSVTRLISEKPG